MNAGDHANGELVSRAVSSRCGTDRFQVDSRRPNNRRRKEDARLRTISLIQVKNCPKNGVKLRLPFDYS